jgi:hypothetical protein
MTGVLPSPPEEANENVAEVAVVDTSNGCVVIVNVGGTTVSVAALLTTVLPHALTDARN